MSVMQPRIWGPASGGIGWMEATTPGAFQDQDLDDLDDAIAGVFVAPKDGNIDRLLWVATVKNGNPPDMNAALVALDAAGAPTQVAYGGSAVEIYTPSATGLIELTLDPAAAVNAGDILAVHIWPGVTAPDAANSIDIASISRLMDQGIPYVSIYNTSWAKSLYVPPMGVRYSDGSYYGLFATQTWGYAFDTADTPDEVGMKITLPAACKCCGAMWSPYAFGADASADLCLYDSGSNLLASWSMTDEDVLVSAVFPVRGQWDEQTLAAGNYYLTVKATHATATSSVFGFQFSSAAFRAASSIPEAANVVAVRRTDAGAWTEDDTALPWMALLLSDVTFGGGSGPRWV